MYTIDWLIDCFVFCATSALFQPCNGGNVHKIYSLYYTISIVEVSESIQKQLRYDIKDKILVSINDKIYKLNMFFST